MPHSETPVEFPDFETSRLMLRELTLEDTEGIFQLFSDPDVVELMDIEPVQTLAQAEETIRFHINDSGTRWGLFDKKDGALIGSCGYHCWNQTEPISIELGYDLAKAYWGQGLMTEALRPVIDFGFEGLNVPKIEATPAVENHRSIRLLEKFGFQRAEELVDGLYYYFVMKDQWQQK